VRLRRCVQHTQRHLIAAGERLLLRAVFHRAASWAWAKDNMLRRY
jgi:hypothetical protein